MRFSIIYFLVQVFFFGTIVGQYIFEIFRRRATIVADFLVSLPITNKLPTALYYVCQTASMLSKSIYCNLTVTFSNLRERQGRHHLAPAW